MKQVVIENPIINSPFEEPRRHFKFDVDGITDEIMESRRISHYFIPIAQPKKKGKQLNLELGEWTQDRVEENKFINQIRERVKLWRRGGYLGVTSTTRKLLEHWTNPERDRRLFFCQIEALETLIYITEISKKYGDHWIGNQLREFNADANPLLFRMACKMATGTGKTVLMSMIIAWHVLNKAASKQDARFGDTFLVVTPGITIRDRLRVLQPNDPENYYRKLDLVPSDMMPELEKAKILITNYHAFKPRERTAAGKLTKNILSQDGESVFTETTAQMVSRVCRSFGIKKNIIVLNDEAHHCYRRRVDSDDEKLAADDRKEVQKREEEARVWISGLEAIQKKIGVKIVYDLSATPFFLKGSGYPEGNLFPWVVSDFSLIDAIESGIVKIPRVPISDNNVRGELPTYRNIWPLIRDDLPKKSRAEKDESKTPSGPNLPQELEGAILSLYNNYEARYQQWKMLDARAKGQTPPVFIVVCNNTNVSKLVYDYISGWDTGKVLPNGESILAPGKLFLFSNVVNGRWTARPNSILVDSEQLESGEAMSADFKKIAKREIDEFKAEYRDRFPGQDTDKISDEDLLREVMNTVGKSGKLGEQVKCVVSVSMLTEGWDCLDSQTEILTVEGWKGIGSISEGELIYSLNPESKKMEIVPVLEYGERLTRNHECMVSIKSQHFDIRTTEGHRFYIKYRNPRDAGNLSKNLIIKTGLELYERSSSYALPLSSEMSTPFVGLPLSDDEIRLIAWFMTDGGFSGYQLSINQSKEYHHEIRALLERLKLDYSEQLVNLGDGSYANSKPCYRFSIPKGTHGGGLKRNGWHIYTDYLDKSVSPKLHQMTRAQFEVFWEEMLKGDGEQQANKSGWLWCCEKSQVDAYTHMAVVRGFAASYHPEITDAGKTVYRVTVRDRQWITTDPNDTRSSKITLEKPLPQEKVWCVRNQNSTLVTRRNGKVVILGNCNTVTHILGVRAFGTQLLCEQVVGRGLRRISYAVNDERMFEPEYAEVYGVPFAFIPCAGSNKTPKPTAIPIRVRALDDRTECEITFPRLIGYRYDIRDGKLTYNFDTAKHSISTADLPTITEIAPIVGQSVIHDLSDLRSRREQEVAFLLAKLVLEKYFRWDGETKLEKDKNHLFDPDVKAWLFPQLLQITKLWLQECVTCKSGTFIQELLLIELAHDAADKIYTAIASSTSSQKTLKPILRPYDTFGSTRYVDFDTTRPTYATDGNKCHVSHVVADTESWEQKMAQVLEDMDEVICYVKNQNLGFKVPYAIAGEQKNYVPDFLVKVDDGQPDDPLNLILEVSDKEARKDKAAKTATTQSLWIPAVNNHGGLGRWAFIEITDPWDAENTVRAFLQVLEKNNAT